MGFAVYHFEKGSAAGGGIGHHIDRAEGAEHTYEHADPERRHLNRHFECRGSELSLPEAVNKIIEEDYNGKRKIRTDAIKYVTHILTGSHEEMHAIFSNPQRAEEWINANRKFIADEFGEKNIVRFTLHLDEKTPHIHAVTVPLTEDGRLSAKVVVGNKKYMQDRQDRYAKAMKKFGLKRGIKNTGIKHENATEYYARMNEGLKIAKESDLKAQKNLLGAYSSKSVEKLEDGVKSLSIALQEEQNKTRQAQKRADMFQEQVGYKEHQNEESRKEIRKMKEEIEKQKQILEQERADKERMLRDSHYFSFMQGVQRIKDEIWEGLKTLLERKPEVLKDEYSDVLRTVTKEINFTKEQGEAINKDQGFLAKLRGYFETLKKQFNKNRGMGLSR